MTLLSNASHSLFSSLPAVPLRLAAAMLAGIALSPALGQTTDPNATVPPQDLTGAKVLSTSPAATNPAQLSPAQTNPAQTNPAQTNPATADPAPSAPATFSRGKKKTAKDDKVVQSKDTKKAAKNAQKIDVMVGQDSKLPDKQLYDKAVLAAKKGHYDVARLDLQTMLNTYPDSQYQMRAKLAIADSWYKEGGTAALTQAESEYADFRVFFPNAPEAAEAQMRIGDIYFRQMDKPDRDYTKATHAEEEYRRMLTDYPNAPGTLTTQAQQRLRDVQEVLAFRESDIAAFYATHENWAATIARYQTVVDTYPLYSHMDDTLIGLGDAYEAEARYIRSLKLPEGGKARLEKLYDGKAADAYREVVLNHAAAPHVEDAKDRLAAMSLPIPVPSKDQLAASEALENSRRQYTISSRAVLFFMHSPDTVTAARVGDPTLVDPKPTLAPAVNLAVTNSFKDAFDPRAGAAPSSAAAAATTPDPAAGAPATPASEVAAPLAFKEVGTSAEDAASDTTTTAPAATSTGTGLGTGLGAEILTPGVAGSTRSAVPDAMAPVGPKDATPLPPVEAATEAPTQPNDVNANTPQAQAARADGKKTKAPAFDKSEESSSKHPKKKGIKKVNPF